MSNKIRLLVTWLDCIKYLFSQTKSSQVPSTSRISSICAHFYLDFVFWWSVSLSEDDLFISPLYFFLFQVVPKPLGVTEPRFHPLLRCLSGVSGGSLIPVRSSGNQSRLVTYLLVFSAPKTANTVKSFQELRESLEIPIETILLLPAVSNRSWLTSLECFFLKHFTVYETFLKECSLFLLFCSSIAICGNDFLSVDCWWNLNYSGSLLSVMFDINYTILTQPFWSKSCTFDIFFILTINT